MSVETTKPSLLVVLQEMEQALNAEREALRNYNVDALVAAIEHKQSVCSALADPHYALPLSEQTRDLDPANAEKYAQDHKLALQLALELKDSNVVNGKIVARSQNSVRETLAILSGKNLDGLYGQTGQTTSDSEGTQPIAKV